MLRKGVTVVVLMATTCTNSLEVKLGGTSMKDVGGAGFAGSSLPFLGRERAAIYGSDVNDPSRYCINNGSKLPSAVMMMMFITIFAGD